MVVGLMRCKSRGGERRSSRIDMTSIGMEGRVVQKPKWWRLDEYEMWATNCNQRRVSHTKSQREGRERDKPAFACMRTRPSR